MVHSLIVLEGPAEDRIEGLRLVVAGGAETSLVAAAHGIDIVVVPLGSARCSPEVRLRSVFWKAIGPIPSLSSSRAQGRAW